MRAVMHLASAFLIGAASAAKGQCYSQLPDFPGVGSGDRLTQAFPMPTCDAIAGIDHDGDGPMPTFIYRARTDCSSNICFSHLAVITTAAWPQYTPPPPYNVIRSEISLLALEQPTANLPAGTLIINTRDDIAPYGGLYAWNGFTASTVGQPDLTGSPDCMIRWDPDGEGPQPAVLVVGGRFRAFRSVKAAYIAALNADGNWQALGNVVGLPVKQLLTHDFDGPGPDPARLVAVTTGADANVYIYDGEGWTLLPAHFDGLLASHDPDGDGPLLPRLYQTGITTFAYWDGGALVPLTAEWDYADQTAAPLSRQIYTFDSFDPDGPGPLPPKLVVGGDFYATVDLSGIYERYTMASLEPQGWQKVRRAVIPTPTRSGNSAPYIGVRASSVWHRPGTAPGSQEVLVAGASVQASAPGAHTQFTSWNGSVFASSDTPSPLQGAVLGSFDFDGPGPDPERVFLAGTFQGMRGQPAGGMAIFQDGDFVPMGRPESAPLGPQSVSVLRNPDGTQDLIGFHFVDQYPRYVGPLVVRWHNQSWEPFGPYSRTGAGTFEGRDLCWFDDDGPGPHPPTLFFAGWTPESALLKWNGASWIVAGTPQLNTRYRKLLVWDPDDAGSAPPSLYAVNGAGILRWTGSDWMSVAAFNGVVNSTSSNAPIMIVDPDGDGPLKSMIVKISGAYGFPDYYTMEGWDGTTVHQLLPSSLGDISDAVYLDPDGDGPDPTEWYAIGAGGCFRYHDGDWRLLSNRINFGYSWLRGYSPGVAGPAPNELWTVGPTDIVRVAVTGVQVVANPEPVRLQEGQTATFRVDAVGGVRTYRWRHNAVYVTDGPGGAGPGGGIVSGSGDTTLTITGATCADAGHYDCYLFSPCNTMLSNDALLTFNGCGRCGADLNADGVQDQSDIATLVNVIAGRPNTYTFDPDFNEDGNVDQDDIAALMNTIAGGDCP